MRKGVLLDFIVTDNKRLFDDVKIKDRPGCCDHEIVDLEDR